MNDFKVGIDNYCLYPLDLEPLELMQWAQDHGAQGVAFSGLDAKNLAKVDHAYLTDLGQFAGSNRMYLEWGGAQHVPRDLNSWTKKEIFQSNEKAARQAFALGTRVIRSCSGGLMRWRADSPPTETLLREMAEVLLSQRQMLKDHGVILAIETHFEFTTFELLKVFEQCEAVPGEYLGICLDTMNLLTMLEHPVTATERVLPFVVSTHIKDGGILLEREGLRTFTAEIGTGVIDFVKIFQRLRQLKHEIHLSIEDHGGDFLLPIFESLFLSKFPDLTALELSRLLQMAYLSQEKVTKGHLSILERSRWPEECEQRIARDIHNLKRLVRHEK